MQYTEVADYAQMSRYGAEKIFRAAKAKLSRGESFNLGLATGNTMIELYSLLAGMFHQARTDLRKLRTFNLDEYVSGGKEVPEDHPLSYRRYMKEKLFSKFDPALGFPPEQAFFPPADRSECYDAMIEAFGGLDFQLLGIGFNGHIAFNEPIRADRISVREFGMLPSRVIDLEPMTIAANARLTAGNDYALMPTQAVTMGMKPILEARQILLLACFPEQAAPLRKVRSGVISPETPASYLNGTADCEIAYTGDCIRLDEA